MTDPSLYSFSDEFFQNLLNAQQQAQPDEQYYTEEEDSEPIQEEDESDDYEQKYNDLNDQYQQQVELNRQLQEQVSQQSYLEPEESSDDPSYITNFLYENVLGTAKAGSKFQAFGSYEEGKNALLHQLKLYQTGKTRNPVGPNSSLLEAMSVYAPSSDNNDPQGYANFIAKQIGVSANTPISQIDTDKWAGAIEKMEGNKVGNNPGNLKRYQVGGEIEYHIPDNVNMLIY